MSEVQNFNPLQGVTFKRESLGNGTFNAIRIEQYASSIAVAPAWDGLVVDKGYLKTLLATHKPAGTSVMWGTWKFKSKGLFTAVPGAHAAFIMRALSTGLSNIGAGFIIGGLSTFTQSEGGACGSGIRSQPEIWFENSDGSAGNKLLGGGYCGPALQDWKEYSVSIHVADTGYAYTIRDTAAGVDVFSTYVPMPTTPSTAKFNKATGWTTGIVFGDVDGTSWEFEIYDLNLGWF